MATFTWDGQTNSNWSNALNWASNFVPATGDDVLIFDLPPGSSLAVM